MIPLMWAPYFIEGGTQQVTLDKIELIVAPCKAQTTKLLCLSDIIIVSYRLV